MFALLVGTAIIGASLTNLASEHVETAAFWPWVIGQSIAGIVVGLVLSIEKTILKCDTCGAAVAAS